MFLKDIMVREVQTCHGDCTLDEIARLMWNHDVGAVPVVSDDYRPLGIITDRDITMSAMLNHLPLWELKAVQVIEGQHLCACHLEDPIESFIDKMQRNSVRRIVVVKDDGCLAGILSLGDVLAFTVREAEAQPDIIDVDETLPMLKQVSGHHHSAPRLDLNKTGSTQPKERSKW